MKKLVSIYPTSTSLLAAVNFDNVLQHNNNKSEIELICTNKPLLHEIEKIYGYEAVHDIVTIYIIKFQDLLSIKEDGKLNDAQVNMLANNIIPFLRGMTLPEIVVMFKRFLSGEFGHFYGNIDIMTFGAWIREFKKKRGDYILKNKEARKFIVMRDQNYNENNVSWIK